MISFKIENLEQFQISWKNIESSLKFNTHISKKYNKFKMWLVRLNLMGGLLYQVLRALNDQYMQKK